LAVVSVQFEVVGASRLTDDEEEDADEDSDAIPEDPYFVRNRSGRREKELPDVRDYLPRPV
jgi:hypothetical protein